MTSAIKVKPCRTCVGPGLRPGQAERGSAVSVLPRTDRTRPLPPYPAFKEKNTVTSPIFI